MIEIRVRNRVKVACVAPHMHDTSKEQYASEYSDTTMTYCIIVYIFKENAHYFIK